MSYGDEVLAEFRAEGLEHLDALEKALLDIDSESGDAASVDVAFRAIHSLKGAAGFLQRPDIERVTHYGEELLDLSRKVPNVLDSDAVSSLLRSGDACRRLLEDYDLCQEPWVDQLVDELVAHHRRLRGSSTLQRGTEPGAGPSLPEPYVLPAVLPPSDASGSRSSSDAGASETEKRTGVVRAPSAAQLAARRQRRRKGAPPSNAPQTGSTSRRTGAGSESTIRVDVTLLDSLMNLVGELVVSRNRLTQTIGVDAEHAAKAARRIDQLTSELQERAMKTRMRPIASAWATLPRTVRDLSTSTGKEVRLRMSGQDTELDRGLLEVLKDPLVHMVRNAVDHGLETREERIAAGKPEEGGLELVARHSGGMLVIEIRDDGRGIDVERLKQKALSLQLIQPQQASAMTDAEAFELIFHPGLSTAEAVTTLSGRGVGMDAVRASVLSAGGAVDVHSELGVGTTFTLKLPLTLAIVPALVVRSAGVDICIQQNHLIEIVDLAKEDRRSMLSSIGGVEVFRLRDSLLPVVRLHEVLKLDPGRADPGSYLVIVESDGMRYGVFIDRVEQTEDIVVKPIGVEWKQLQTYSGATVRGDGSVCMILDIASLGRRLGMHDAVVEREAPVVVEEEGSPCLAVQVGSDVSAVIPLHQVRRTFKIADLEMQRHNGALYVVFEEQVVPVVPLDGELDAVVICEQATRRAAIGVTSLLEVLTGQWEVTSGIGPDWSAGMTQYEGRVMAMVDVGRLVAGEART